MKFWQLLIVSVLAMAVLVHAEEADTAVEEPAVEASNGDTPVEAEPEQHADDDSAAAEPESPAPESSPVPGDENEDAADDDETDAAVDADTADVEKEDDEEVVEVKVEDEGEVEEVVEVVEGNKLNAVEKMEGVIESSQSAAQGTDGDNGAVSSLYISFSTLVFSTLAALKFAH